METIQEKSKKFALEMIQIYKYLTNEQREFVLSKQLLRSGTSIGANAAEAKSAQSRADFYSKLNISLKEARETTYWLDLLHESGYLDSDRYHSAWKTCDEIIRILVSITKHQSEETKATFPTPTSDFRTPNSRTLQGGAK